MKSKMVQLFLSSFIKSSHERAGDSGMLSVAVNFIYHVWFGQKDRSILNLSLQLYLLISELYSVCVVEATLTRGEGPLLYCFEIKQQRFFHMTDIYRLLCDLHYVGRCFESEGDFLHTQGITSKSSIRKLSGFLVLATAICFFSYNFQRRTQIDTQFNQLIDVMVVKIESVMSWGVTFYFYLYYQKVLIILFFIITISYYTYISREKIKK